jgi:hypothetical protein
MVFSPPVTDRIHARSGGVPRLINVISDATLVFGYGEEKYEIDAALVDEVIRDLDGTGVLGPRPDPNHRASVVPVQIPPTQVQVAAAPPPAQAENTDVRLRELVDRELRVTQREREVSQRERELVEQRRVLAEQYRLLRTRAVEQASAGSTAANPAAAAPAAKPAWPPATSVTRPGQDSPAQMSQPRTQGGAARPTRGPEAERAPVPVPAYRTRRRRTAVIEMPARHG